MVEGRHDRDAFSRVSMPPPPKKCKSYLLYDYICDDYIERVNRVLDLKASGLVF